MRKKRVAILCSKSLKDGLFMMVASHRLTQEGFDVTTFHNQLREIANWFPEKLLSDYPPSKESLHEILSTFDMIILQHDKSARVKTIVQWAKEGLLSPLSIFYPFYHKHLDKDLNRLDRVFNHKCSMVENISLAISSLLNMSSYSMNNGLFAPAHLFHKKEDQVVIDLTPGLAQTEILTYLKQKRIKIKLIDQSLSLENQTALLYQSSYFIGAHSSLAHLASNLHIPSLLIHAKTTNTLFSPGWLQSQTLLLPRWLPKWFQKKLIQSKLKKTIPDFLK